MTFSAEMVNYMIITFLRQSCDIVLRKAQLLLLFSIQNHQIGLIYNVFTTLFVLNSNNTSW